MPIYSSKLSKFANNSPILFIFNFWSRDMAQEDLEQNENDNNFISKSL